MAKQAADWKRKNIDTFRKKISNEKIFNFFPDNQVLGDKRQKKHPSCSLCVSDFEPWSTYFANVKQQEILQKESAFKVWPKSLTSQLQNTIQSLVGTGSSNKLLNGQHSDLETVDHSSSRRNILFRSFKIFSLIYTTLENGRTKAIIREI